MYSSPDSTTNSELFYEDLTVTTQDKSKVKISQTFVAFSEYMNSTVKLPFTKKRPLAKIKLWSFLLISNKNLTCVI